jgi:hypothetical protein
MNIVKAQKFEFVPPSPLPASPLAEKTVIALLKLKAFVLAEPRRYNQRWWGFTAYSVVVKEQEPPCGTACCLAGSAVLMEGCIPQIDEEADRWESVMFPRGKRVWAADDAAIRILGLERQKAKRLFDADADYWYYPAHELYTKAESLEPKSSEAYFEQAKMRAKAAAMELDHLIATGFVNEGRGI